MHLYETYGKRNKFGLKFMRCWMNTLSVKKGRSLKYSSSFSVAQNLGQRPMIIALSADFFHRQDIFSGNNPWYFPLISREVNKFLLLIFIRSCSKLWCGFCKHLLFSFCFPHRVRLRRKSGFLTHISIKFPLAFRPSMNFPYRSLSQKRGWGGGSIP